VTACGHAALAVIQLEQTLRALDCPDREYIVGLLRDVIEEHGARHEANRPPWIDATVTGTCDAVVDPQSTSHEEDTPVRRSRTCLAGSSERLAPAWRPWGLPPGSPSGMRVACQSEQRADNRVSEDGVHLVRTHLANVLLALEMLARKAGPGSHEARVIAAGLSSARKLARLLL
jgi:hypothetical protein